MKNQSKRNKKKGREEHANKTFDTHRNGMINKALSNNINLVVRLLHDSFLFFREIEQRSGEKGLYREFIKVISLKRQKIFFKKPLKRDQIDFELYI